MNVYDTKKFKDVPCGAVAAVILNVDPANSSIHLGNFHDLALVFDRLSLQAWD